LAPGDYVDLEVTDTGHGMDEETKSRIFESFFTTKEVGQGTGLGLWMAHEITERSRGAITVKSAIGRGTSFRLCLPRAARGAKAEFARVTPHTSQASAGGTETIMVVDDEAGIRELVSDILKSAGYRVLLVRDGAEALAAAEREVSPIHLLITDVAMPGVGGRDLSTSLAASRPGIKVLYISGYSHSVIAGERAAGYLQKPFRSEALRQRVRDLLDAPPEVTILIVDDDPSVRGFLGDILRPIGYLVVEAANGNQTLHSCGRGR
jgi:CheY-like chemotaxis protein